jgi:hypothetical protein
MDPEKTALDVVPLIRSLYPKASEQELAKAQQAFTNYVAAVLRIFDRIERERQHDSHNHANDSRINFHA